MTLSSMRWRVALLAVVTLAVAAALAAPPRPASAAYVLWGFEWPGQPAPGSCCANLSYETATFIWDNPADETGWTNAATAWNDSPALVFINNDGGSAINLFDTNDSSVSWIGLTTPIAWTTSNGVNWYQQVQAELNAFKTQNLTAAQIQTAAAHELGHVFGLAHDTTACALMNPDPQTMVNLCGQWVNTPQPDDVAGVNAMY